ncbi:PAS domain-containing protein 2 [Elsinoe fawcettii]|nr:PAS domain-containing protein 2 [Elsinoe fawcettii]
MPSLEGKRRADSVTEHHVRHQPIQTGYVRKASYSLYPNCSSTPTSPNPQERMSLDSRRPKVLSQDTALKVPTTQRPATSSSSAAEPLVDDFHARLLTTPSRPGNARENSLPGLDDDMPITPFFGSSSSASAPAPPDLSKPRTLKSVRNHPSFEREHRRNRSDPDGPGSSIPSSPEARHDSSRESFSQVSTAPTDSGQFQQVKRDPSLVPLQTHGLQDGPDQMETFYVDDPRNFDLIISPPEENTGEYQLEVRSDQLFSQAHLQQIFADPKLLLHFSSFLNSHRPKSVRLLMYYLDAIKAIRAIKYANGVTEALDRLHGHDFSSSAPPATVNRALEKRAEEAFEALARTELPAYVTYTWIQVVHESVQRRVTGTLAPHLREASEGLAEVFCLSDPSRPDNPIVFASEEFQRTTQYGMNYCVGRNCRFLQGPRTNPNSVRRLAAAVRAGQEHSEVFLNYRRDGSPFMNLLMIAPLHDSQGTIRYFIGAQVDVSNLAKDATDLDGLRRLIACERDPDFAAEVDELNKKEPFHALSEMFNTHELATIRRHGGRMHREQVDNETDRGSIVSNRARLVLTDPTSEVLDAKTASLPREEKENLRASGRLQGPYQHYLLLRPHPSLRILFTSPSLRIPGMLQSPFLSRIGGSSRVRSELSQAFAEGRGVTAKIRWLTKLDENGVEGEGRSRWIHATPLLSHRGEIGVWMVVLVDAETREGEGRRRFRDPPTVSDPRSLGRKDLGSQIGRRREVNPRMTIGGTPVVGQRYETMSPETVRRVEAREKDRGKRQGQVMSFLDSEEEMPSSGRSEASFAGYR